tara:strand:- start:523 stop:1434 length:912 start_codon:yes stop_codon:yes gene_type:complete
MSFAGNAFASATFSGNSAAGADVTVNVTGQSLTLTLSNAYSVGGIHHVNGEEIDLTLNSVVPQLAPTIATNLLTSTVNSVIIGSEINVPVTGNLLSATVNSTTIDVAPTISGFSLSAGTSGVVVLDPEVNIDVTGNALTATVGTVQAGVFATVLVSGTTLNLAVNNIVPNLAPTITGNALTATVGTVQTSIFATIDVTGESLALAAGNVSLVSDSTVQLIGNLVQSATSGVSVFAWATVPTTGAGSINGDIPTTGGGGVSWTEVSTTGAGSINGEASTTGGGGASWTEVSTTGAGSIDQQEVA